MSDPIDRSPRAVPGVGAFAEPLYAAFALTTRWIEQHRRTVVDERADFADAELDAPSP